MRFVVCGEALIDLMPEEMISPAESRWIARSGGGPFNTATALAKLGLDTRFLGRLSTDTFGRQLRSHLEGAGVDLSIAVPTVDPNTWRLVVDGRRRAPGRGAYVHPAAECLQTAIARRAFGRALRLPAGSQPDTSAVQERLTQQGT